MSFVIKLSFAKFFVLSFLMTIFSCLYGEEVEEPTLLVDSISLQVMTDLIIPGKDDPLAVTQEEFFIITFSEEEVGLYLSELSLSGEAYGTSRCGAL